MKTTVALAGTHPAADLRELQSSLLQEPELRGRVHLAERPPERGHLGGVSDVMSVLLGAGPTTVTVLVSAVITWLRYRTSDVNCTITKPDGSTITLSAKRVQQAGMEDQHELIRDVSERLSSGGTPEAEDNQEGAS